MTFDPMTVECPQCGSKPGYSCTNYKGKVCAPHRDRKLKNPEKREQRKCWKQTSFVPEEGSEE